LLSVTGVPTLDAFSTSWLSGMMPSRGCREDFQDVVDIEHLAARGARRIVAG
jgi:hypothetical protein